MFPDPLATLLNSKEDKRKTTRNPPKKIKRKKKNWQPRKGYAKECKRMKLLRAEQKRSQNLQENNYPESTAEFFEESLDLDPLRNDVSLPHDPSPQQQTLRVRPLAELEDPSTAHQKTLVPNPHVQRKFVHLQKSQLSEPISGKIITNPFGVKYIASKFPQFQDQLPKKFIVIKHPNSINQQFVINSKSQIIKPILKPVKSIRIIQTSLTNPPALTNPPTSTLRQIRTLIPISISNRQEIPSTGQVTTNSQITALSQIPTLSQMPTMLRTLLKKEVSLKQSVLKNSQISTQLIQTSQPILAKKEFAMLRLSDGFISTTPSEMAQTIPQNSKTSQTSSMQQTLAKIDMISLDELSELEGSILSTKPASMNQISAQPKIETELEIPEERISSETESANSETESFFKNSQIADERIPTKKKSKIKSKEYITDETSSEPEISPGSQNLYEVILTKKKSKIKSKEYITESSSEPEMSQSLYEKIPTKKKSKIKSKEYITDETSSEPEISPGSQNLYEEILTKKKSKIKSKEYITESSSEPELSQSLYKKIPTKKKNRIKSKEYITEESSPEPEISRGSQNYITTYTSPEEDIVSENEPESIPAIYCPHCQKIFPTHSNLMDHLKSLKRLCDSCDKVLPSDQELKMHLKEVHNIKGYKCSNCNFFDFRIWNLKIHQTRDHCLEYMKPCEDCNSAFPNSEDLEQHVSQVHNSESLSTHLCDVCGKGFQNSYVLQWHIQSFHECLQYACKLCDKVTFNKAQDTRHKRWHADKERLVCDYCGKEFDIKSFLLIHMRQHTGEKPHICSICSKAFAKRNTLRQHLLIHSGKRPYVCDICGKSFTQKPGLSLHRKTHPGDLPPMPKLFIDDILKNLPEDAFANMGQKNNISRSTANETIEKEEGEKGKKGFKSKNKIQNKKDKEDHEKSRKKKKRGRKGKKNEEIETEEEKDDENPEEKETEDSNDGKGDERKRRR